MRNNKDRAMEHKVRGAGKAFLSALCALLLFAFVFTTAGRSFASEGELRLRELIDEALRKSPEILASQYRADASQYRIPQAQSLPDPMFMFGYQNEGWSKYTWGDMQMSWWMFSASQMVPFPGKLSLKGEMASKESESLRASYDSSRLKVIMKVKELYYDLFLGHKNLDLLKDRVALFSRIEDAATARYSSGMGPQQDVLMAQTEKYMLLEKEEMQKQKIQSLEAMLNSTIGREVNCPLGRPTDAWASVFVRSLDELLRMASENSPEVRAKERMVGSSETKVRMAEKEYYPDFTFTGNVMKRRGEFDDMWSLTAAMNIPLYYRSKQRQAVSEAKASLSEARSELEAAKLMIASNIRDSYSMLASAQRLMELYRDGLIPKTTQDFESALAGYRVGKVDALTVISRLRALLEFETLYWTQFVEKEKAAARLEAMSGIMDSGGQ